ncbi:hypothetical protein E2C01_060595 [Portunus trituberculatus]|uniref:Uncharacterized protein n=1 Tax=Portunus trituberculatus TaxID=210409 RepID=A0A5B7HAX4_PORTR|nr:hypothetical protein [Portunus trituberculatus]
MERTLPLIMGKRNELKEERNGKSNLYFYAIKTLVSVLHSTNRLTTAGPLDIGGERKPGNKTQRGENIDSSCKDNGNGT